MAIDLNGIAHIRLNVKKFEECAVFYRQLFEFFRMQIIFESADVLYAVGAKTGLCVARVTAIYQHDNFDQNRIGLHHFCFRARSREDVDAVHVHLQKMQAKIVTPSQNGEWAKGYYSVLFEDPEGIRLEVNFVPGKGNLDPETHFSMPDPTKKSFL